MAIDAISIGRIEACLPKTRTTAVWAPRLAQKMQALRDVIAFRVKQNQWKLRPLQPILEEAFGPCFRANRKITDTRTSSVFWGWEVATGRSVVIKESLRPNLSYLFSREGEILQRLRHPQIVDCLMYGEGFVVTEGLERSFLDELHLSYDEVLTLVFDVAEILRHCHQNQIVIRDLKDEHLLFSKTGVVKLIDLGSARDLRSGRDIVWGRTIIGTPSFLAPEVIEEGSAKAGAAADYYSLGVTTYEVLTGKIIQKRKTVIEGRSATLSFPREGPIFTPDWSYKVPELFHPILKGLLQRRPERRLADPDQLQTLVLQALIRREESLRP